MQTGLTPNPLRGGKIARVLILGEQDGQTYCLDPRPFDQKPDLLKPYNPGLAFALKFWRWVSALVFLGGIAASFFGHWWAFLPGWLLSWAIHNMNTKSAGQFAAQVFKQHERAASEFEALGALFAVPSARVVGRRAS